MAPSRKNARVPDPVQEEEMSVVVLKFRGSGETLRRGMDTVAQAIAALGGPVHVITRGGNGTRQPQIPAPPSTLEGETVENGGGVEEQVAEIEAAAPAPKAPKKAAASPKYSFLADFDLAPAGKISLRDFVAGKNPATENDRYLLVSLWLQTEGGTDPFTGNHLFTCLRALDWKYRLDVNAPVREMKSKKSWFDSPAYGKWRLTQPGITAANAVQ